MENCDNFQRAIIIALFVAQREEVGEKHENRSKRLKFRKRYI